MLAVESYPCFLLAHCAALDASRLPSKPVSSRASHRGDNRLLTNIQAYWLLSPTLCSLDLHKDANERWVQAA